MMHLLRKYDIAPFGRNDAMIANSLGEADIIHAVNIIIEASSFAVRQTSLKKKRHAFQRVFLFLSLVSEKELSKNRGFYLLFDFYTLVP